MRAMATASRPHRPHRPLRIAVIGVGTHGTRYARHATNDVDAIELVAVCRRDRDAGGRLGRELGCEFSDDALELARRDDIDGLVLSTVPDVLEPVVTAAAEHGKRLLVEKPVARSLEEGLRMAEAIERAGVYCLAGQTLRFNAVCRTIRARIDELGELETIVLSQGFPPQPERAWLDRPERSGGGNVLHTGTHGFDLVRFFSGRDPASVHCSARSVFTTNTEDRFAATIELADSDVLATVACSRTTHARNGLIEVVGERAHFVGDHVDNTLERVTPDGRERIDPGPKAMTVREVLERFAADAREGSPPPIDYRDGLAAVAVADACYRSIRSGRREPVGDWRRR